MVEQLCDCAGQYGGSTFRTEDGRERCDICGFPLEPRWSVKLLLAWYDLWVGAYWDRAKRRLYILPLPCVGVVISFPPKPI